MEPEIVPSPIPTPSQEPAGVIITEPVLTVPKKRKGLVIAASVFSLFVLYYTIMALISPAVKISAINSEFGYKQPENTTVDKRIFTDSAFIALNREKAYNQARITMAETDSICLSLNLSDSTAILEIKGVAVNISKISRMNITKVLYKADEYALSSMLSMPFTMNSAYSTIKKEPVMLKIAPKDTSEYKPDILPDTTKKESVNYFLQMDNGFRLYVYQDDDEKSGGSLGRFLFDINDRFRNSWDLIKSICVFRVPEYHPAIRIRLPKADAKIIYRALPRKGQIALYR
jgi:hypothetical protein